MLIDTIVTIFVAGFVAIVAYGHLLVAQALLTTKDGRDAVREPATDNIRATAVEAR